VQAVALDHVTDAIVGVAEGTSWNLEWMEVSHSGHQGPPKRFYAPQRLSNPATNLQPAVARLEATAKPQRAYQVVVKTSGVRGAGTDAGARWG
jgi:hypothetical protein